MKETIKNLPVLGKLFVWIYETVFKMCHFVKHVLFKEYISESRWRHMEKELRKAFSDSEDPEIQELLRNIKAQGRMRVFNYPFVDRYQAERVAVYEDEKSGYRYVMHPVGEKKERLYFPREWSTEQIRTAYNNLLIEQDPDSPHYYYKEAFPIPEDAVVLDCGVAEGNFSLGIVKQAKHVYLFEGDPEWHKPLELTFAGWKDKVTLVPAYISDVNENGYLSLDAFFEQQKTENETIFIKMDIEGYEEQALNGFRRTLGRLKHITMAVCSYHKQESEDHIRQFFAGEGNYKISTSKGYMILNNFCEERSFPYIRRGLLFVKKFSGSEVSQ